MKMVAINLGTIHISEETYRRCKVHGYSRQDIVAVIVQNGEDSLMSQLDDHLRCLKCGVTGTQGTSNQCNHHWIQK